MSQYIPERGDVVWLTFDPQLGHEQAGRRPTLILSPASYNHKVGLVLACPITSRQKGYAFEVAMPDNLPIHGVVLADQLKSLDWRVRNAEFITQLPLDIVAQVLGKLSSLLSL